MPMKTSKNFGNFRRLSGEARHRMIVRSWGSDKTGKNHFGYTGPSPIFGQYFDPGGDEGVADKFIRGEVEGFEAKEIHAVYYRFDKTQMDQKDAIRIRDQFIDDYEMALEHARLIQWDETEVWELFRWAEFAAESDAPRSYGPLNARYRMLIQAAYDKGCNLQLVQKVKERWGTDKNGKNLAPMGVFDPQGFKECNYIVQANLEHSWTKEDGFRVKIVNCRQNMTIAGEEFTNFDWPTLGQLVFPNSTSEDWA